MSRLRGEAGMTLVELIMTMAIMVVVLAGITELFVSGTRAEADLTHRFQAQTQLRVGLDALRRDVHSACAADDASTGVPLADGATPTGVTLLLPPTCTTADAVTWCVQGSGTRYGLYRAAGVSCGGGVRYADYLTTSAVFTYTAQNVPAGSYALPRLHVHLVDDVTGGTSGAYTLDDDVVFRNGPRCTVGVDCP